MMSGDRARVWVILEQNPKITAKIKGRKFWKTADTNYSSQKIPDFIGSGSLNRDHYIQSFSPEHEEFHSKNDFSKHKHLKAVNTYFSLLSKGPGESRQKPVSGGKKKSPQTLLFWAPKSLQMVTAAMKLKDAFYLEEKYDQPRQHITKQKCYFANKVPSSQGYGFSSSHVWMWELDYKGRWVPKNWCFWTVVLEKTLESPLGCKEIQPVHPKYSLVWLMLKMKLSRWNSNSLTMWCKELTHQKRL